jgi:GNAT superfamily N-acetyltransferase
MITTALDTLVTVPFATEHLDGLLDVLLRLRAVDTAYPPADAGSTRESLAAWLMADTGDRRVILRNGVPAGHIMTEPAHPYLPSALDAMGHPAAGERLCEIGRFFTDPSLRNQGLGSTLFTAACDTATVAGYRPALAVLEGSVVARRFYASHGMVEAGTFSGVHGINHVFVRDLPADVPAMSNPGIAESIQDLDDAPKGYFAVDKDLLVYTKPFHTSNEWLLGGFSEKFPSSAISLPARLYKLTPDGQIIPAPAEGA